MQTTEDRMLAALRNWKAFRLLVIGDFMLDQALEGDAERLSPDAPVPVLAVREPKATVDTPGGAGNVSVFARALGGSVACVGVIGRDEEGGVLRRCLEQGGCATDGLIADPARPTTVKRSLIGRAQHRHPQKMFRIDVESRAPISEAVRAEISRAVDREIERCDVVCIEDYNKGVCSAELCAKVIARGRQRGIPVLVDPAAINDYGRYRGATAITPNRSEAEKAVGRTVDPADVVGGSKALAAQLRTALDLDVSIVTLDRFGAVLQERTGEAQHLPTLARPVYDVAGAGDMVLAVLAGAAANRVPWPEAVALANVAAGMEVEVFGVQAFTLPEVQAQVIRLSQSVRGKLRTRADLLVEIAAHRAAPTQPIGARQTPHACRPAGGDRRAPRRGPNDRAHQWVLRCAACGACRLSA